MSIPIKVSLQSLKIGIYAAYVVNDKLCISDFLNLFLNPLQEVV